MVHKSSQVTPKATPALPVELYGLIIDSVASLLRLKDDEGDEYLDEDARLERTSQVTLEACSLTCKLFERLSRPHLFYYIDIQFSKMRHRDQGSRFGFAEALMELIAHDEDSIHDRQRLSQHIRSLSIQFNYDDEESLLPLPISASGYTFEQIFSTFNRLHTLTVFGLETAPADLKNEVGFLQQKMTPIIQSSKSLRTLFLCDKGTFFAKLSDATYSITHLTHLRLAGVYGSLKLSHLCWLPYLESLVLHNFFHLVDDDIHAFGIGPERRPSFSLRMLVLQVNPCYQALAQITPPQLAPLWDFFHRYSQHANCDPFPKLEILKVFISPELDRDSRALASLLGTTPSLKRLSVKAWRHPIGYLAASRLDNAYRTHAAISPSWCSDSMARTMQSPVIPRPLCLGYL
ncbi:hypothetical protein CVT24_011913 [Panaeolus cyanescens]|uniref:F-box domain-containing protein n=1 Tax=Panaeolus cyanescens TaxID=181874 RepID=A0A409WDW4_9AGAR|nr:hypothetical protein CVT24_011913 [Panaeolus cyanescens]